MQKKPFQVETSEGCCLPARSYNDALGIAIAKMHHNRTYTKVVPEDGQDLVTIWEGPDDTYVRIRQNNLDEDTQRTASENIVTVEVWSASDQAWVRRDSFLDLVTGDLFRRVKISSGKVLDGGQVSVALGCAYVNAQGVHEVQCRNLLGIETHLL